MQQYLDKKAKGQLKAEYALSKKSATPSDSNRFTIIAGIVRNLQKRDLYDIITMKRYGKG